MRNWMTWVLIAAVVGASSFACASSTAPAGNPVDVVVVPLTGALLIPAATVAAHQVTLTGALGAPDPCYTFRATATRVRETLQVRLIGTGSAQACITVLGQFRYTVTLRDVPPGEWTIDLSLEIPDSRISDRLFRGVVRVE